MARRATHIRGRLRAAILQVLPAVLLPCLLALAGCSSGAPAANNAALPPPPQAVENPKDIDWNPAPRGIKYRIETTKDCNLFHDVPLGITMAVYQLSDFSQLMNTASTPEGIDSLLSGAKVEGVLSCRIFQLQPGAVKDITADRMEKAKYLAVVAGFAHMRPELCAAALPFPVHQETRGLIFRDTVYSAGKMQALIRVNTDSVTLSGVERVQ